MTFFKNKHGIDIENFLEKFKLKFENKTKKSFKMSQSPPVKEINKEFNEFCSLC